MIGIMELVDRVLGARWTTVTVTPEELTRCQECGSIDKSVRLRWDGNRLCDPCNAF